MTRTSIVLLLLLGLRVALYFMNLPTYVIGDAVTFETQLDAEPAVEQGRQRFLGEGFFVTVPLEPRFHFGDKVRIDGTVSSSRRLDRSAVRLVAKFEPNLWEKAAFALRGNIVRTYQAIFPNREASLLSGVVLGSVGLDRQFKGKLADVGLTHVVAASGMNVTIFSGFVILTLSRFRLRKIYIAMLSIVSILFYSTVTGFEPPIVRAGIMAGLTTLAMLVGRQNSGVGGLLLAAYLMLWASPKLLVSASFLLSFGSMAGQVFLSGLSLSLPKTRGVVAEIWEAIVRNFWQSFLAIVFTLPLVLIFFAKFSLVSLITNTLVLWTVEPLMILGGLVGLSGLVSPDFAQAFALAAEPLLRFFLWVVDVFSGKDYFLWHFQVNGPLFAVGYYLALGGFVWWWATGTAWRK